MKKKLFSILPLIALGSCATKVDVEPMVETPEIQQQIETVESTSSVIPSWYKELPEDDKMIYSSGTAIAPDLQLSVDIATMNAKTVLADRINGKLDSMTKQFIAKTGTTDLDSQVLNELERVSKNVIASVDVAGYKIEESDITQEGTQYRAYVLLAYNNEEATKVLMNRMKRDKMIYSRIRSTEAWKELEEEVNKSKDEDEAKSMENVERLIDENDTSI